jgi:Zn ribbon nucleic-acid-binding protein
MIIKNLRKIGSQNNNFLIIPLPLEDEVFSSWFVRTAYAHHFHPQSFFNIHFGLENRDLLKRDIDCFFDDNMLTVINNKCNNKINSYFMTLKNYSGYLQEKVIISASNRFISHQQYCPECLKEDNIPYFRKYWKFTFNTICIKHKCFLHNTCPKCNSIINITKMHKNKFSFVLCNKCGFNLTKTQTTIVDSSYQYGTIANKKLNHILNNGYVKFNHYIIYSFVFFDVIIQLTKIILLRKNFKYINHHPLFTLLQRIVSIKFNDAKSIYLQLTTKENFALFGLIIFLFENYPFNLKNFIKSNSLSHWDMVKHIKYLSYWYDNLINSISPRYVAFGDITTKKEIQEGIKYLKKTKIYLLKKDLSKLFDNINYFTTYNKLDI